MAKQTVPDSGLWSSITGILNANYDELYASLESTGNQVVITQESDFPTQDGTTITLEEGVGYFIDGNFTTAKYFICDGGSIYSTGAGTSANITYTGTDPMFLLVSGRVGLRRIVFDCPSACFVCASGNGAFDPNERVNMSNVQVKSCDSALDITSLGGGVVLSSCLFENIVGATGMKFAGSGTLVIDMQGFAMGGLGAGEVGIDFGTAVANGYEIANYIPIGDGGAIPIKGSAESANVASGGLMVVEGCSFDAFTTPLQGISVDDIRVDFQRNAGLLDSSTFSKSYLDVISSPETVTTGLVGTYAELATTNFITPVSSRWSVTNAGVATFNGERTIRVKFSGFVTATNSGGGSDNITARIAINWSLDSDAGIPGSGGTTESNDPASIPLQSESEINPGDNVRVIWSNLTNGSDIEVSAITLIIEEV